MIVRITLASGKKHVGIPSGDGGRLGGGAAHSGIEAEHREANRCLKNIIRNGGELSLWPVEIGDVPYQQRKANILSLSMAGASYEVLTFEEAKPFALVGEPYPSMD